MEALKKNNIDYVSQYPIRGGLIADFAIPNKKIIIECDGEYYHKLGNNRDKKKDFVLKKLGWVVLRFRGQEIKNNIESCIKTIKMEVRKNV